MNNIVKKIIVWLGIPGVLIIIGLFILVACLFTFDFFGATVTDGYVEGIDTIVKILKELQLENNQ